MVVYLVEDYVSGAVYGVFAQYESAYRCAVEEIEYRYEDEESFRIMALECLDHPERIQRYHEEIEDLYVIHSYEVQ